MFKLTLNNLFEQARQAYLTQNFELAAQTYIRILTLLKLKNEVYFQTLYNLGLCLRELGQTENSHQVFEKLASLNPNFITPTGQSIYQTINQNLYFWVHHQDI